jgi:hypothetical protein
MSAEGLYRMNRIADDRDAVELPLPRDASPEFLWQLATDPLGLDGFVGLAIIHHPNTKERTIRFMTRSASHPDGMSLAEWRAAPSWDGQL